MRSVLLSGVLLALTAASATAADPELILADFEGGTYAEWKVEGTAFGDKPATGTLPNQMVVTGFRGKGLVNSYVGGDKSTGTLTSPAFTVERNFLNFLIGGGSHPGKTCINLLLDGKVVRTATGPNDKEGGTEELAPAGWDVKEFKGKRVVIQIVDQHTGGWGHINVDHITQSDAKAVPDTADRSREIVLAKPYLLFPIGNAAKPVRMTIAVGGKVVHDFDINLAADKPDWWARLDVPQFAGQTAKLEAQKLPVTSLGLDRIETADAIRHTLPLYDEALRPQLRFSQMQGWNNDPNGMVYHDGEYHLFWQSNPFGPKWGNMYWGHAVSRDLIHWQELPHALYPRTMAKKECFSGSAHVDERNTGGWGKGAMVAAFTDTGAGEALAVSTDRGRTWKSIAENPVIPQRKEEGRDPKLIWYEPGQHWVIAAYTRIDKKNYVEFYSSTNLKQWQKTGQIEGYYECPELFELPVDGDAKNPRWVLMAADAKYAVGKFDGKTFTPDHAGKHQVHHGAFYASQCFSRVPGGRVIQIGWAQMEFPNMPFNQAFSLPIELRLRTTADGVRLLAEPIQELATLREKADAVAGSVSPEKPLTVKAPGQLMDIILEVEPGDAKEVRLQFGTSSVVYHVADQKLDGMPLKLNGKPLAVRVVVDRPMYEVVGGGGAAYKTAQRADGGKPIESVRVSVTGGSATVRSLTVHPMRSIWAK